MSIEDVGTACRSCTGNPWGWKSHSMTASLYMQWHCQYHCIDNRKEVCHVMAFEDGGERFCVMLRT